MKPVEQLLCSLLRFELDPNFSLPQEIQLELKQLTDTQWQDFHRFIQQQAVTSFLADSLYKIPDFTLPKPYVSIFQKAVMVSSMHYYQSIYLFQIIEQLFQEADIFYYLLKGLALSALYPQEELRKTGDLDLYVPDPEQFRSACRILKNNGFEPTKSMSDHHVNFNYKINETLFELELHCKPIARFYQNPVDSILENFFKSLPKKVFYETSLTLKVPTFEPTINAFYLLLHMLQHFLDSGFGIRLLCDWTVFLKKHKQDIDTKRFMEYLHFIHIEHFCYLTTGACIHFLGLTTDDCPWMEKHMPNPVLTEQFLNDLFQGGEFGRSDTSRMVLTMEKPSFSTYLHEIHKSMRKRYQRASQFILLWPILWILTLYWYFYSNHKIRNTSTWDIIKTSKKRYDMFQYLDLFKNI